MKLIEWNNSLSVKIDEIDRQHQKLIDMINDLNDGMSQGKGKDVLGKIISGLVRYAGVHFKTEERYFDQFGYSDAEAHKTEHAAFTKKVADFKEKFDQGKIGLSVEVMTFLSDWLKKHIKGTDQLYVPLFLEKGLK